MLNNIPIVSVTQALDEAGVTKYWESRLTPYYLERGNQLDKTIELHLTDRLADPGDFSNQLEAFKKFEKQTGFKVDDIHTKIYSRRMWYAGTLDFTGKVQGINSLIELKAETYQYWYELQTAGYMQAYNEMFPSKKLEKRFVLNLKKDGNFKLTECKTQTDFTHFYGCVLVANYKIMKGASYNGNTGANTEGSGASNS